ncbi:unnamed protein product [Linum trigynum]|uniref:Uncharacterized protein n=1 Tax=Linum trigynum TaxID=586398 RepID=A0AAV2E259_9ROSI
MSSSPAFPQSTFPATIDSRTANEASNGGSMPREISKSVPFEKLKNRSIEGNFTRRRSSTFAIHPFLPDAKLRTTHCCW